MLPERAAIGEPAALALWLAVALAVYGLATLTLSGAFARAALLSAGAPAVEGRTKGAARFSASLGAALRAKEQRLLWRDPWLLSQMGLQALYSLPIGFILWRNGGVTGQAGVAFAPTLVVIAGQLAASLAWIALCGEEAPDFIATAPATRGAIERAKLAAISLPVAIVMAAPLGTAGARLAARRGGRAGVRDWRLRLRRVPDAMAPGAGAAWVGPAAALAVQGRRCDRALAIALLGGDDGFGGARHFPLPCAAGAGRDHALVGAAKNETCRGLALDALFAEQSGDLLKPRTIE